MSNPIVIKTIRHETIGNDNRLLAAKATLDLRRRELEIARKAVLEAEEQMDLLIDERFNELNLKVAEGELIHLPEYDLAYFWSNGHLYPLPTRVLGESANE